MEADVIGSSLNHDYHTSKLAPGAGVQEGISDVGPLRVDVASKVHRSVNGDSAPRVSKNNTGTVWHIDILIIEGMEL